MSYLEECCRPSVKEKFYLSTAHNVETALNDVKALRPQHPFAFNLAGAFYFARGNYDKAEKYYLQAHSLDARRPGVLRKLADLSDMRGDSVQAVKLRKRARELFPSNPEYREQ